MRKFSTISLGFVLISILAFNSCSKGGGGDDNPPTPGACGTGPMGPLFTQVRAIITNNCNSCHNNSIANGGMNWTIDCNLVFNKERIKVRAVDNVPSSMPPTGPLPQADKDKITAWLAAGGRFSD
jgi:uncharacterized membrane protein